SSCISEGCLPHIGGLTQPVARQSWLGSALPHTFEQPRISLRVLLTGCMSLSNRRLVMRIGNKPLHKHVLLTGIHTRTTVPCALFASQSACHAVTSKPEPSAPRAQCSVGPPGMTCPASKMFHSPCSSPFPIRT